jgi:hypothetical protein
MFELDYGVWRQSFGQTNCGNEADLDANGSLAYGRTVNDSCAAHQQRMRLRRRISDRRLTA